MNGGFACAVGPGEALGVRFTLAGAVQRVPEAHGKWAPDAPRPRPLTPARHTSTFTLPPETSVHPSVRRGCAAAWWEGQSLRGVCGDVVTLGITPRERTRGGFSGCLTFGFILWPLRSPAEQEGCFPGLEPAEDCNLGNRGRPLLFYFCEEFSNENRSLPVASLLGSPCEFLCCVSRILSAGLSSVPPHQLPVPPCFIFNKR